MRFLTESFRKSSEPTIAPTLQMARGVRNMAVALRFAAVCGLVSVSPFARPVSPGQRSRSAPTTVVSAEGDITTISANNLEMTDSMRAYVVDKVGGVIEKYGGTVQRCDVHLSVMRNPAARLSASRLKGNISPPAAPFPPPRGSDFL